MHKLNFLFGILVICFIYLIGNYFATGFGNITKEGMVDNGQSYCIELKDCQTCQDPLENTVEGRCVWDPTQPIHQKCIGDPNGEKVQQNCNISMTPSPPTPSQPSPSPSSEPIVVRESTYNYYYGSQ